MKRFSLFWRVGVLRALIETFLAGAVLMSGLILVSDQASQEVIDQGFFFLCPTCALWCALRLRIPDEGKMWRRLLYEDVAGIGLSLLLGGGLYAVAFVLGWWDLLTRFYGSFDAMLILIAGGPAFLVFRVGAWLWRFWNRLRRKRLIWALTHAHLTLVVLIMLLLATLSAVEDVASPDPLRFRLASDNLVVAVVSLTYMILPLLVSMTLLTVGTLLAALPPSAILSYFRASHDAAVGNPRHCHQGAARRRPCGPRPRGGRGRGGAASGRF